MENRLLAGSYLSFALQRLRSVPWEGKSCTWRLHSPAPRKDKALVLWLGPQAKAGLVGGAQDSRASLRWSRWWRGPGQARPINRGLPFPLQARPNQEMGDGLGGEGKILAMGG